MPTISVPPLSKKQQTAVDDAAKKERQRHIKFGCSACNAASCAVALVSDTKVYYIIGCSAPIQLIILRLIKVKMTIKKAIY